MSRNKIGCDPGCLLMRLLHKFVKLCEHLESAHGKNMRGGVSRIELGGSARTGDGLVGMLLGVGKLLIGSAVGSLGSAALARQVERVGGPNQAQVRCIRLGSAKRIERARHNRGRNHIEQKVAVLPIATLPRTREI